LPSINETRVNRFKSELKNNLLDEFDRRNNKRSFSFVFVNIFKNIFRKVFNHALVTAVIMPVLLMGSLTTYAYSSSSVYEGHVLYPVKLSLEKLEYSIVKTPVEKAEKKLKIAERRLKEVEAAIEDDVELDKKTLSQVANFTLSAIQEIHKVKESIEKQEIQEKLDQFSEKQINILALLQEKTGGSDASYLSYNDYGSGYKPEITKDVESEEIKNERLKKIGIADDGSVYKPEPAKSELVKPEPTKPEPAKPELVKPEPTKLESAKPELTKPESAKPISEDEQALNYLWRISNEVKNINIINTNVVQSQSQIQSQIQAKQVQVNQAENFYNPRLIFKPNLSQYQIAENEYLIQTDKNFTFYVDGDFVDTFGLLIRKVKNNIK